MHKHFRKQTLTERKTVPHQARMASRTRLNLLLLVKLFITRTADGPWVDMLQWLQASMRHIYIKRKEMCKPSSVSLSR